MPFSPLPSSQLTLADQAVVVRSDNGAAVKELSPDGSRIVLADSAEAAGQTVVLTGGTRTPSEALVGPIAVGALRTLHVDLLFLGVHGLDERVGLTTPNLVEAETNRALIECARTVCVTADHTKWGVVGRGTIVALDRVDILVTDEGLSSRGINVLSEHIDRVIVAP